MRHKFIASLLVLGSLGLGTTTLSNTSAQAASWHKGAPKIARGTWGDKDFLKGHMGVDMMISKKLLVLDDNDPHLSHLRYKKVGHRRYKFRGYEFELRKNQSMPTMHFINKHHVTFKLYGHKFSLYK
ncbi:hypothetical protein IV54_GL001019 [Levilactobacillus paucivorans]|uniref:DUF4822 domain-containing protein n=1 Tax=Levilactobacillus paucivorans TaxID=616990 RepID=A0A0R2LTT9_9LACO|nr:hypothetical protein [Levilactobacillus paucivorans]KRO04614.1 hypothetical protein IV54_GL001019 [Levilactobacillus paucivorans]